MYFIVELIKHIWSLLMVSDANWTAPVTDGSLHCYCISICTNCLSMIRPVCVPQRQLCPEGSVTLSHHLQPECETTSPGKPSVIEAQTVSPRVTALWQQDNTTPRVHGMNVPPGSRCQFISMIFSSESLWGFHWPDCRMNQLALDSYNSTFVRVRKCKRISFFPLYVWWMFVWLNYHWKLKSRALSCYSAEEFIHHFQEYKPQGVRSELRIKQNMISYFHMVKYG